MNWKTEWKPLLWITIIFLGCFYLPVESVRFEHAILEALHLVKWYAREHFLLCLVPAFFIAGAIGVFVSQGSVIRYLGPEANKLVAYGVASVSGTVLAVCSCTILPLFAGIYRMGAGIGPATAFLYSGPAINALAIVLTASVLGAEMGFARAVGAIVFSVVIGGVMAFCFRQDQHEQAVAKMVLPEDEVSHPLWQKGLYFFSMIGILVFANWGHTSDTTGIWAAIYGAKWLITSGFAVLFGLILVFWFKVKAWKVMITAFLVAVAGFAAPAHPTLAFTVGLVGLFLITSLDKGSNGQWFATSWGFARQILPLLLIGVFSAGVLFGSVGQEGLVPAQWVGRMVGGNSLAANLFASVAGAFMYFATLTEIPILQGLMANGMGKGPALALLLAGPALSLPNMLVIRSVLGTTKTVVFVCLVIIMATISGLIFGTFF